MLYHSDPTCSSSKVSELRADERKSEHLKLQEVDPAVVSFDETQIPNFCIRDYVFASRSKNNHTSWPFPCRLLKLFLKHGVKDLLPPFEPASSVRDPFCKSSAAKTEKNIGVNLSQVGETLLLDEEHNPTQIVSFPPSDEKLLSFAKNGNSRYLIEEDKRYNLINEDYEIGSTLTNQCAFDRFSTQLGAEPVVQHCSLILKPSVISETSRAEDIASTSTASDLMASKICPVCKTFSSTSNTTLNAHMDQCLFMASDATKIVDKTPKLLVKPTKKRLMEDIYATAPHCSLEDLDRRNGTSWAKDLTSVTPPIEANTETKKLKLISQVDARDDRSEGAVYIDSNGIKLRILSKFNDAPQVISKNAFKPSKNINLVRDGKTILVSQKKYFVGEKHIKKMKLKMKNKKLSSLKLLKNEAAPEVDHNEESHKEEESADQLSGEEEQTHMSCGTSTLQKWHCSKRSDLPKKICKTNFLKNMVKPGEFVNQITKPEIRNSASGTYSSAKRHFMKLSQTPESKIVDFPANAPLQNMANEVKSLQGCSSMNVLHLKLAKASGALVPSKNSKNDDLFMGIKQNSPDFPETNNRLTENRNLLLKTKKISTLSKSNVSTKMLRKNKRKREISSGSNEEQQRYVEAANSSFLDDEISERSLLSGSWQCQDVKTKSSVSQNQNMGIFKFTRASPDKVDGGAIIAKSVNGEVLPVVLLDLDDKTSQIMSSKDCERSMERVLLDKQDEKASDRLENRGVKSQAGAASTESSACLTSHGDLEPDTPRQTCSIASAPLVPNQESNMAINREPSGSPVSSSSISPAFLNVSLTEASDRELLLKPSAAQENLGRYMADNEEAQVSDLEHNQQCKMDFTMNKSQQQSNYHHCCCSRQSIIASTMPTSKPKLIPNLHIRPSISAPFGAYSILHTDTGNITSLESPTGSIMTRSCSVVGSTSPSCGTPSQSSSNSILRLMGKNLMVTHNEESSNLLKIDSPVKDNNSSAPSLPSPLSFTSYVRAPNHENFPFAVCSPVPLMTNMKHKAYVTKEVILFDGSSSNSDMMMRGTLLPVPVSPTMFQGPYPYFLPQNQLLLREIGSTSSYLINEGSSLEVPATLLPRPFLFRPPNATPLNPPLYPYRL